MAADPADTRAMVARAQAALDGMADELEAWAREAVARLDAARRSALADPDGAEAWRLLHRRAHDLKGLGSTTGHPLLTRLAASLCRLFECGDAPARGAPELVAAHVDAAVAVMAAGERGGGSPERVRACEALEAVVERELAAPGR